MKIYAPNKQYAGVSAGVPFVQGVGETDNPLLVAWFRQHGYDIEEEPLQEEVEGEVSKEVSQESEEPETKKTAKK